MATKNQIATITHRSGAEPITVFAYSEAEIGVPLVEIRSDIGCLNLMTHQAKQLAEALSDAADAAENPKIAPLIKAGIA